MGHSLWKSRRTRGPIAYSKEPVKNLDMCPSDDADQAPGSTNAHEARTNPSMPTQRFLQLTEVSEILNISAAQAYALVRSGELPAIKVGGRGQWRVETTELENYIQRMYSETRQFVAAHPFGTGTDDLL
jgi:excisionase family DNA binding protein